MRRGRWGEALGAETSSCRNVSGVLSRHHGGASDLRSPAVVASDVLLRKGGLLRQGGLRPHTGKLNQLVAPFLRVGFFCLFHTLTRVVQILFGLTPHGNLTIVPPPKTISPPQPLASSSVNRLAK
jgi:hypothetical protein